MSHTTGDADRPTTGRPEIDWQAELARHDRWLRTIAYARLGEADAVEEIMQEVALAALVARAARSARAGDHSRMADFHWGRRGRPGGRRRSRGRHKRWCGQIYWVGATIG